MDQKEIDALYQKYLKGECSPEEVARIERSYLEEFEQRSQDELPEVDYGKVKARMWNHLNDQGRSRNFFLRRLYSYASAAAVLLCLAIGYYFISYKKVPNPAIHAAQVIKDVLPGGNKATLTLSNGNTIILDNADAGKIATQSNAIITKIKNGVIAYSPTSGTADGPVQYNTIATPKGGQYQVALPDGSKVWLNAASKLKFPSAFHGQPNRQVELSGEAYFEVAKNENQPFVVVTSTQQIQVLGTHFNVNSYSDETSCKTTLLEGSVRVFSTQLNLSETLKPGQMALHQSNRIMIQPADENATAWKDGMIKFYQADLQSIMQQVSRWYDLEIKYEGPVTSKRFTGGISRDSNLSELLQILEGVGIHFSIERQRGGNVLIVKN